ncbi:MAG: energy transducer TonB [Agriterribacter sp.]
MIIYDNNIAERITRAEAEKRGLVKAGNGELTIKGPSVDSVICFLDGVEVPNNVIHTIDPNLIKSVTVLKGANATDKYGEKGRNGVVEITSKKNLDEIVVTAIGVRGNPDDSQDKVFEKVEVEATFPGGEREWTKFISREINKHIDVLQKAGNTGKCVVQFIVDTDGKISDVHAITMQGTHLAEIVINAVKNGPDWVPATQNGIKVKSYRRQPVTFNIAK